MTYKTYAAKEARARFAEMSDDLTRDGYVVLTRNGKPFAALIPVDKSGGPTFETLDKLSRQFLEPPTQV